MAERRRTGNSTRDRENAERVALRRLVSQLEAHVNYLQHDQLSAAEIARARERAVCMWRRLVERQARARRAAERTNTVLSDQVQANADWIQHLWEILSEKRQRIRTTRSVKCVDSAVFARLKTEVRLSSLQWHEAFEASHIRLPSALPSALEIEDHWSHVKTPNFGSRLVCVRHLPFDALATTRAMWTALTQAGYGQTPVCVVERSPGQCALKYQTQIQLEEDSRDIEFHAVTQQVTGDQAEDMKLFVWQSLWIDAPSTVEHSCVAWFAVASCPSRLESVVAIIAESQVRDPNGSSLAAFQTAVMPCLDACIDDVLVSVENTLFDGEKALRSASFDGDIATV